MVYDSKEQLTIKKNMSSEISVSTIHEINFLHSELESFVKIGMEKAIRIGELLSDCKAHLKHGELSEWITENCTFSARTARNYMKLYNNRDRLTGTDSLSEAYRLLKTETVSVLDEMKSHLQDTINEDLQALDSFDIRDITDKLPNPEGISINNELAAYEKQLGEAQQIAAECHLRSQRKTGQLLNELENLDPADQIRVEWLKKLYGVHPGISLTPTSLHLPDDLPYEAWVKVGRLLSVSPYKTMQA